MVAVVLEGSYSVHCYNVFCKFLLYLIWCVIHKCITKCLKVYHTVTPSVDRNVHTCVVIVIEIIEIATTYCRISLKC